jgi:cysteine synthase B
MMNPVNKADVAPVQSINVIDRIGNTPLLRLERVGRDFPHIEFYAKAEWFNPGGSVKDRPALNMILEGERSGKLKLGKVLLDATSGNTGIAYAMVGAARGYKVRLCMPANASIERKRILRAYGAELLLTDPAEGADGAIRQAREIYAREPDPYFYADQYNNPANWQAHYNGTANEIWNQTGGGLTHFVAGLGTTGTFVGTTRRLKELNPNIHCVSLQPDSSFHGLEGWKHMPTAIVPGIYDDTLADENLEVRTEDAYKMVKGLAREEGLLASPSAGAALWGAFQVAKPIEEGLSRSESRDENAVMVIIFPDGGDKYLSERFWDED